MFHAPMGRFQLELIYYFTYFSTVVPSTTIGWDDGGKIGKNIKLIVINVIVCPSITSVNNINNLNFEVCFESGRLGQ